MVEELDNLAKLEKVDRAQLIRKIIEKGIGEEKLTMAVALYQKGDTLERAASLANVSLWDLIDFFHIQGISTQFNIQEEKILISNALKLKYPDLSKKILEM